MLSATRTAVLALALAAPGAVYAQTSAASDPFSGQVEQKCTEATADVFRRPMVAVDPQGTETYGVAIVFGRSKELKGPAAVICVVDRKTGKVEVGSPLGKDVVRVRKAKPEGQDDNQKAGKKQQNQDNQQQNQMNGNAGGQDDDGDDDSQQ